MVGDEDIYVVGKAIDVKWTLVLIGFILAVLVKAFMGSLEFLGLLIVGFLVGFVAKQGALGGMINAAIAGALGGIIGAIIIIMFGALLGLVGFIIFGISGFLIIIFYLIYYGIIMGIAGAIGGILAK
ncbi:MAG: DUF5518 domain-containing protein [Methanobrevibacter sp.]|nr:DUF5518 domain-containing protein [Methanobrevibacter sp.]